MKILVGFDGSDQALDALRLGEELSRLEDAELVVAAVFDADPLPVQAMALSEERDAFFAKCFQSARRLASSDFEELPISSVSAARGLADWAVAEGAGLIVVGSSHRGSIGRILLGSTGEGLTPGAPCPVAVAPLHFHRRGDESLGLIGVAYDGTPEADLALDQARAWAVGHGCRLRLISVVQPLFARYGPDEEIERAHLTKVQRDALARLDGAVDADGILEDGDPAEVLVRHAAELDLLVIGSRGYGRFERALLGGVSAAVMRTSACPVLVVPRGIGEPQDRGRPEAGTPAAAGVTNKEVEDV